ncbi:hypothetical protein DFJ63DRAFT_335874 [Scheffersomyces coipomensis]|uniref:uncharacterized protein n=1 Tax=Scheffersomyces coipomensis TaxID=1788519 RepID=UPI00315DFF27
MEFINDKFPDACDSKIYRIRIIAQVVEYIEHESSLLLGRLPRFQSKTGDVVAGNDALKVNIIDAMPISHDLTYSGAIVNAEGYYDGNTVNVFHCFPINGQSLIPDENAGVLTELNNLESFV